MIITTSGRFASHLLALGISVAGVLHVAGCGSTDVKTTAANNGAAAGTSFGFVGIGQGTISGNVYGFAWAGFHRSQSVGLCSIPVQDANCRLMDCPPAGDAGTADPSLNAGTITIAARQTVQLELGATGSYSASPISGSVWAQGDSIAFDIAGANGDPPAFTTALIGPAPITLIEPSVTAITVNRTQALGFSWSGGATGVVSVQTILQTGQTRFIDCTWAPSVGSASISPTLLSGLPAGSTTIQVSVNEKTSTTPSADWSISATASAAIATLGATLQ